MLMDEITSKIASGESSTLEFKKTTAKLMSAAKTLCGFLNGLGGTVYIGVTDNGDIIGQEVSDRTMQEISNILQKFEPVANISIKYIETIDRHKKIISLIAIPDFFSVPYTFDGRPYERSESSTHIMPQTRYQQLLFKREHNPRIWERGINVGITLNDLDCDEILNTLHEGIRKGRIESRIRTDDPYEALKRMRLLLNGEITNSAVVLFGSDNEQFMPQCLLRMVKFNGKTKDQFLDIKRVFGNAFKLLDESEQFFLRHLPISSRFESKKFTRVDEPAYPPESIREAMVNAICHRDYSIVGGSVSMMIYEDRIEISSHGRLPNGVTVDNIKTIHESQPRNERITDVMYKRGAIESVGHGIEKMLKLSEEFDLPEPQFEERGNIFVAIFSHQTAVKTIEITSSLSHRQEKILELLVSREPCSTSDILSDLGENITVRTLRNDLKQLRMLNLLDVRGKGKNTLYMRK